MGNPLSLFVPDRARDLVSNGRVAPRTRWSAAPAAARRLPYPRRGPQGADRVAPTASRRSIPGAAEHRAVAGFRARPGLTSLADLAGRRLAVHAPTHASHTAPGCFARTATSTPSSAHPATTAWTCPGCTTEDRRRPGRQHHAAATATAAEFYRTATTTPQEPATPAPPLSRVVNHARTDRAPLDETVTFVEG